MQAPFSRILDRVARAQPSLAHRIAAHSEPRSHRTGSAASASSEIESQRELHPPRIPRRKRLTEEWSEIGIRPRNSEIRMIECVECFPTKFRRFAFPHNEPPMQRDIH